MTTLTREGSRILAAMFAEYCEKYRESNPNATADELDRGFILTVGLALVEDGVWSQKTFDDTHLVSIGRMTPH